MMMHTIMKKTVVFVDEDDTLEFDRDAEMAMKKIRNIIEGDKEEGD